MSYMHVRAPQPPISFTPSSLFARRTSFHPLTNRKHHCRLCGRIVCSLPPKPPNRPVTCSLLIVADPRTKRIEEVPDVIAYGVTLDDKQGEREKYVKGVRVCRTCRAVVAYVVSFALRICWLIYGRVASSNILWKLRSFRPFREFIRSVLFPVFSKGDILTCTKGDAEIRRPN